MVQPLVFGMLGLPQVGSPLSATVVGYKFSPTAQTPHTRINDEKIEWIVEAHNTLFAGSSPHTHTPANPLCLSLPNGR